MVGLEWTRFLLVIVEGGEIAMGTLAVSWWTFSKLPNMRVNIKSVNERRDCGF